MTKNSHSDRMRSNSIGREEYGRGVVEEILGANCRLRIVIKTS